jgi:p-hydroxybenzoate 3-monooxygenase
MRTQVGIVGAGPAGLLLSHLLDLEGIESVVLEDRSREYVENRVRAGVLEQGTVELLTDTGLGDRLHREALVHRGLELRFDGEGHRIDLSGLTDGRTITIYGQQEVVKDLIAARLGDGGDIRFEVEDVALDGLTTDAPSIAFTHDGERHTLECAVVAGCDGFHGICRKAIPDGVLTAYDRTYPFGWLGILARVGPSSDELVYTNHERGFSLLSVRSPEVCRMYLQCEPDEDIGEWSDDRIWDELHTRTATRNGDFTLKEGPIFEKGVAALRSFVVEPMQYGRLFLAGDAAHIVPATGAKGLNLAVADVRRLSEALARFFGSGDTDLLEGYSDACLRRVWRVQHFSWWMTSMLHRFGADPYQHKLQISELQYVTSSTAAATTLAENYVGLPL